MTTAETITADVAELLDGREWNELPEVLLASAAEMEAAAANR